MTRELLADPNPAKPRHQEFMDRKCLFCQVDFIFYKDCLRRGWGRVDKPSLIGTLEI